MQIFGRHLGAIATDIKIWTAVMRRVVAHAQGTRRQAYGAAAVAEGRENLGAGPLALIRKLILSL